MLVERATERDLPAIATLVSVASLPSDGLSEAFEAGVVLRDGERLLAAAAVERYGPDGLLRSVVVAPERRGEGLGRMIVEGAEALAREVGIERLYLLTETAAAWFPRLGYTPIERADAPAAVRGSIEFTTACASTAVAMCRTLPPA